MIGEQIYHGFSRSQVRKEGEDRSRVLRISVQVGQQKIVFNFKLQRAYLIAGGDLESSNGSCRMTFL